MITTNTSIFLNSLPQESVVHISRTNIKTYIILFNITNK